MKHFLLGAGSPLVDYSVAVSDDFLTAHLSGRKGGTLNITDAEKDGILDCVTSPVLKVAGGAAANTVMAAAELGVSSSLLGKTGDDENGRFFHAAMRDSGALDTDLLTDNSNATGYCLTLVTPDAERTMRSNLGASLNLLPHEVENFDFSRFQWVLLEGYFVNTEFFERTMALAGRAGCRIAIDLCSFEMAEKFRNRFISLAKKYADLLFANFAEAAALTQKNSTTEIISCLKDFLPAAALKLGASGSIVYAENSCCEIPPAPAEAVVDTTAAGDYYAAGFFYGLAHELPWEKCGCAGSLAAAQIVARSGTKLPEKDWSELKKRLEILK